MLSKAVSQAIPHHHMYCYKRPKDFLHDFNMILARLLWGGSDDKNKIHWHDWDALCTAKFDGEWGSKILILSTFRFLQANGERSWLGQTFLFIEF